MFAGILDQVNDTHFKQATTDLTLHMETVELQKILNIAESFECLDLRGKIQDIFGTLGMGAAGHGSRLVDTMGCIVDTIHNARR